MPDASVITPPAKRPFEASDREEYKRIKAGEKIPAPAAGPEEPPSQPSDKGSESAAVSETVETKTQEKQEPEKPKRDRSLEGRIKELRAQGKHDEADKILRDAWTKTEKDRADKLEKELQELRTRKPANEQGPPKTEATKPAEPAAAADADDPEPQADKFDDVTKYWRALARWETRQEQREQIRARAAADVRTQVQTKLTKARQAHADFDAVTAGDAKAGTGFLLTPAMQRFMVAHPDGAEVVYHLATNLDVHQRIFAMAPDLQLAELGVIARDLAGGSGAAATQPEKPKPPASRASAPPPRVGGSEAPAPKDPSQARDRSEYKRLRAAQRGR